MFEFVIGFIVGALVAVAGLTYYFVCVVAKEANKKPKD